jgi:CubicO group peptidase (beta-lactamase class C family)
MRVASVSKAFACAAIQALVTDHNFDLDTAVFPYLGINAVALPSQTKDARVDAVTVRQCVNHAGGWVPGVSGIDPVFAGRSIARALGLPGRVSKRDVARYMYGEPLQYDPGDTSTYNSTQRYSNFGYVLLGLVVERHRGVPFGTYVRQRLMAPLGMQNQVFTGATVRADRRTGELSYDSAGVGDSAWAPRSDALVPSAYGTYLIAEMDSGGGLIASAPAVTAFINRNAAWGMGGRAPGAARAGSMPGTRALAVSRADGIDWAYILNSRDVSADVDGDGKDSFDRLADDLNAAISAAGL